MDSASEKPLHQKAFYRWCGFLEAKTGFVVTNSGGGGDGEFLQWNKMRSLCREVSLSRISLLRLPSNLFNPKAQFIYSDWLAALRWPPGIMLLNRRWITPMSSWVSQHGAGSIENSYLTKVEKWSKVWDTHCGWNLTAWIQWEKSTTYRNHSRISQNGLPGELPWSPVTIRPTKVK